MSASSVARLGEAQIDRLAEATWRAIAVVEPALSYAEFLDLPFSVGELIQAFPAVAKAAGLRADAATEATPEASHPPGKSTSTRLIAEVVANTGWTWDEALDGLTVPRYLALVAEWRARPPAHWLIAAALQYRPPRGRGARRDARADRRRSCGRRSPAASSEPRKRHAAMADANVAVSFTAIGRRPRLRGRRGARRACEPLRAVRRAQRPIRRARAPRSAATFDPTRLQPYDDALTTSAAIDALARRRPRRGGCRR